MQLHTGTLIRWHGQPPVSIIGQCLESGTTQNYYMACESERQRHVPLRVLFVYNAIIMRRSRTLELVSFKLVTSRSNMSS